MLATRDNFPLLEELLAEQQRLATPVVRVAESHERGSFTPQLIPLTTPGPGEQYAFEVDLGACTGCKSCVAACHSLNGLDETETWRDVGVLISPRRAHPFTQTITTACHHCADPACLNGCPVLAYEKDPVTGIVRHLDDQCIGCSYCILKCPYDAPKYSARLGIVRKCDMCHGRLAAGEAPACAQACPTHAIRITTVKMVPSRISDCGSRIGQSAIRNPQSEINFLPTAPDPTYTRPTTRYVSARALPEYLVAGDAAITQPQPAHAPLVVMLTLMPIAVALSALGKPVAALVMGAAGLAASTFHLGQPRRAWRIFLGWRRSWLSREALLFGAWFLLEAAAVVFASLRLPATLLGVAALGSSAMIYIDTRRQFWRPGQTLTRFFGTAVVFTLAWVAPLGAAFALGLKIAGEWRSHFDQSGSSRLLRGPLAKTVLWRDLLGLAAILLFVAMPGWLAIATFVAGEFCERYLFFRAVDAPKMPGMPAR